MTTPFPANFPNPDWLTSFDAAEARKTLPDFHELVVHPRYGRGPDAIRGSISEQVQMVQFQFQPAWIFPSTRIDADESKQNFSVFPHKYYVDVLKHCSDCGRWFVFFAKEQQYWFEELRFFRDSNCKRCPECRKHLRQQKNEIRSYSHLASLPEHSPEQVNEFLQLTISLWNRGYFTRPAQLDRAISLAVRYSVDHPTLDTVREIRRNVK